LKTDDINYSSTPLSLRSLRRQQALPQGLHLCHAKELEASGNCQPFEHLGYSDLSFAPGLAAQRGLTLPPDPALDMYTPKFQTLSGDQEIAKGLWLFETPGHTAGHYSLMVELQNGGAHAVHGRCCYSKKNMDMMCISSFHLDPTRAWPP